jgi:hypothetical protein
VDAKTGAPIPGAVVTVESWQVTTPSGGRSKLKDVFRTNTNSEGRFEVPEKKEWFVVIPIPDLPPAFNRRICIEKPGYEPSIDDPWGRRKERLLEHRTPSPFRMKVSLPRTFTGDEALLAGSPCDFPPATALAGPTAP